MKPPFASFPGRGSACAIRTVVMGVVSTLFSVRNPCLCYPGSA